MNDSDFLRFQRLYEGTGGSRCFPTMDEAAAFRAVWPEFAALRDERDKALESLAYVRETVRLQLENEQQAQRQRDALLSQLAALQAEMEKSPPLYHNLSADLDAARSDLAALRAALPGGGGVAAMCRQLGFGRPALRGRLPRCPPLHWLVQG